MSATTTITQSISNNPLKHPVEHSYPPTKSSSSNATPALDNPVDQGGPSMATSMATAAALADRPASRMAALRREKVVFATMCGSLFLAGWNDGTTGPLLPRIQEVYHVWYKFTLTISRLDFFPTKVGFTVVSLIFITSCVVRHQTAALSPHL
jgi:hypothetical protein